MEVATAAEQEELGFAECLCCGLTEECTAMYVASVRGRYGGRWICGLCAEAVEEETCRSARLISMEEALQRQATFYVRFRSRVDSNDRLISIVRRLIRRSLGSPSGGLQAASGKEPSDPSLPVIIGGPLGGVGDGDLLEVKQ